MKKVSSIVWQFYDRVEKDKRCVAVVCKLCDTEYKYFGNTTNLRVHLRNKHPIQWDLAQSAQLLENDGSATPTAKRTKNVRYSLSVIKSDSGSADEDSRPLIEMVDPESYSETEDATDNIIRQMHTNEEWLDEDYQHIEEVIEPKRARTTPRIKRELASPPRQLSYAVRSINRNDNRIKEPKDEYSVFGEYIANKLRKITKPKTRGNIQQIFTTILWQADYGLYDDTDSVKRVLMWEIPESQVEPQSENNQQEQET